MLNIVLSAVVLASAACQMSEPDGEAKVTFGVPDKSPTYAEFKLSESGGKVAHVAVKIVYKGEDPVEMHVKDLREEAKENPVEKLAVDDARSINTKLYRIEARDGKQTFGFTFASASVSVSANSKDDPLYGLSLRLDVGGDVLNFSGHLYREI